ncbi:MAG: hypothetical protein R8G33_06470 [Gammaproteobacteria bacterium]|nr:hypothetical protein [Gammaproteobacteria bacterium]
MSNIAEAPQDSVLRRHWQASREMQSSSAGTSSQANTTAQSGGFFSWLKSLFS